MRDMDWSRTKLGPVETWPQSLRTAVGIMLSSRYAMFVWWGRALANLYNDAYRPFLGKKHPGALGQSAQRCLGGDLGSDRPADRAVLERGESTFDEGLLLLMERYGYLGGDLLHLLLQPDPRRRRRRRRHLLRGHR